MGKDGGGGGQVNSCNHTTTKASKTVFDVHIALLQLIENELLRLHNDLSMSNGDDDTTQSQIGELHSELARLSEQLADAEVECTINGKA